MVRYESVDTVCFSSENHVLNRKTTVKAEVKVHHHGRSIDQFWSRSSYSESLEQSDRFVIPPRLVPTSSRAAATLHRDVFGFPNIFSKVLIFL